jgi:hypothetical protein
MVSGQASQVGRNRAAQYHRTMNPAPLRLRKAPERVWRLRKAPPERVCAHLLTVARPTAPVIASTVANTGLNSRRPGSIGIDAGILLREGRVTLWPGR